MKTILKVMVVFLATLSSGCTDKHLINNLDYRTLVDKAFTEKKQLAKFREAELFSVFNKTLSTPQIEALKFLFAFMPLNDLADYTGDFFLANADMSLRSRTETIWGKDIPEEIFLHYVLPLRVNNENLDSFRIVYYDEILNRVNKGKGMREAALEINHWCHEKVSYQPSDMRTSAPISTILSARGRCGEESTFTVAALRTAGIPARQVYTPRWAHTDDNHAWVEIWFRGEWYYMGACEPEPVLDRGWFTEPVRRAMMVHTKSFGAYWGNENYITRQNNFTLVNNLAKYSLTKKIFVKVLDRTGAPINNAKVEYQLYNYAEFYPVAVVPTNAKGFSQLETGLGDLLIWAYNGDDFNYKKISVYETDTLVLKLIKKAEGSYSFDIDLNVPVVRPPLTGPASEMVEQNAQRINDENIIQQKYIDSWINAEAIKVLALKLKIDTVRTVKIIARSMGNYKEISSFLSGTPDSLRQLALALLEILPDKDLRDIKGNVLSDHLKNCYRLTDLYGDNGFNIYLNYVLNPRIADEKLVSWRSYFLTAIPASLISEVREDPLLIVKNLNENIYIADDENYYKTPLTPIGVYDLKVSDTGSRSICFVAICRTFGIPSRLEPGSNIPQYLKNNNWNDVYFADQIHPTQRKGYLKLFSSETKPVPEYYSHFTISRFEKGRYNTMEYDYNKKVTDFKEELILPPGNYMLVTGNRLADSKILAKITFFNLSENEHRTIEVKLRKEIPDSKIIGAIDLNKIVNLFYNKNCTPERITSKGVAIFWIEPDNEPTKHIFNDLPILKSELDSWGGYFLFLTGYTKNENIFKPVKMEGFPANSLFGVDNRMNVLQYIIKSNGLPEISLPYVILTDKNGNILFTSAGYRIGIGDIILKKMLTTVDI